MDIYELLGEDPDAPGHKHARSLVAADHALVRDLVAVRDRSGMTQASVSRFESGHSDAHLSTVRRYAKAVGALIRHEVIAVGEHDVRRAACNAGMPEYRWASSSTEAARRVSTGKLVGA